MHKKETHLLSKIFLILSFLLAPNFVFANFDFNANCLKAYQNIFELKLNTAKQLIAAEKKIHPNNSIVPLLENYVDYFYLLTTESKAEFEKLALDKDKRIDQIKDDDKNSPYYLYAQAEINLQWALIRGRYGSYYAASREINRANSQLRENSKKFPGFHLNGKGLGLINCVIGALPDGFLKSALATFGVKGDLQAGLNMLDKLAENLPKSSFEPFYEETIFYYVYVLTDVAHSTQAYTKTMKYTGRIAESSLLKTYLQAYVCSRTGHNDEAIATLLERPTGTVYQEFPYLEYLMGVVKLNKLDFSATNHFDKFLQTNKGVNYIKDTYLHKAWLSLFKNDSSGYASAIANVKSKGYTYGEKDKQALNEANSPIPNKDLLRARLFYDGGYLTKAAEEISHKKVDDFASAKDKTEYYYRVGRINDDLGKDDLALNNYQNTINTGKGLKYYFAAKSAVLMGKIYEKKRIKTKAKSSYASAINMKDHEYENSIEAEAKQGLKRIGG